MQNIGRFTGIEYIEGSSICGSQYIKVRFQNVKDYPELSNDIMEFFDTFESEPYIVTYELVARWIKHSGILFKREYVHIEVLEALENLDCEGWAIKNIDVDLTEEEVKGILKIVADGIRNELEDNFLV